MKLKILLAVASFFVGMIIVSCDDDKYVRIGLDASWKQTPIPMEVSEFLAARNGKKFWTFVGSFDRQENLISDKEKYETSLSKASSLLSAAELNVLKFSLSLRSYSPKVQLFQQIGEMFQAQCEIFYQTQEGLHHCDYNKALSELTSSSVRLQKFDHIYPGSESNKHTVVVYGDFTSQQFQDIHKDMLKNIGSKDIRYVYRHFMQHNSNTTKVMLSGYGVELAVKSTEYKAVDDQKVEDKKKKTSTDKEDGEDEVEGFLFKRLRELHPTLRDDLSQFKEHLKESNKELAPLKVWQLQDLSFQASQRIISASSQDVLKVLKDISQNVPMVARSLVKTKVDENMREEVKQNQKEFEKLNVEPGSAALFVNGIELTSILEELNIFRLLKIFDEETESMSSLGELNLDMSKIGKLMELNVKPQSEDVVLDTRSESVQWMNDLEKDSQYSFWPSNLNEILRPTFPGMMRYIAKNIFNVVVYANPVSEDFHKLFNMLNEQIDNSVPARFGIVFVTEDNSDDLDAGAALLRAFSFIKADKSSGEAFDFLKKVYRQATDHKSIGKAVKDLFTSMYGKTETEESLGKDSEYEDLRRVSNQKYFGLGLKTLPSVLINGHEMDQSSIMDNFETSMVEMILGQTPSIQQAVYMGEHHSYPHIYDYLMSKPNVVSRINPLIQNLKGKNVKFESVSGNAEDGELTSQQAAGELLKQAQYFISDEGASTVFVVADANTEDGRKLLKNAMTYVQKRKDVRLSVILHGESNHMEDAASLTYNRALQIVLTLRQKLISGVAKLIMKFLDNEEPLEEIVKSEEKINQLASGITGINKKKLFELLSSPAAVKKAIEDISKSNGLVQMAFEIFDGDSIVVANGRVFGPLKENEVFLTEDFEMLQEFENGRCGYKIKAILDKMDLPNVPVEGRERYRSDVMMKVTNILTGRNDQPRSVFTYKDDKYSVIHLSPRDAESASYDVEAILDPLSTDSQKLSTILQVLYDSFNIDLHIFLNPKAKHSEMPVKRFYQYVLQSSLSFDQDGNLVNDQAAVFKNLPHSALLTLIMDTPQSWLIKAVGNNHDLDNIHLGQAEGEVYGDYELEYIIVEGKCTDMKSMQHPRGLQFVLGTQTEPDMFDTIVMANLGYFQLKAFPGSFVLQLRDGRSSQIYQIDSLTGGSELSEGQNYTIVVDDFSGNFLSVQVKRRPGQEKADLLGGESEETDDDIFGIWESIASYVKTKEKSSKNTDGKIHIFSVATGLLYERFLRIMMLSVLKHTKTPVKFWFLKNYLSAGLTNFLPRFAEKYGFEFELVQYQWPRWLNGQTEKQRIIWGYKILFLDVLFPLNLERIIFVDADQIVRADLKELMDMDLDGAPYAYTPFCNDRPEVEGFRFWRQGYWRNHLAGRPYHISALYVVDLKRFRRVAAGDRLRGQYQGLSQDPNSLANLDQDLPNNMIHQVQIKSLPQEWLWCETWCSDASKAKAKTIDMCNNPQTKEPKLQRAMRIAPEWKEYDEIIKALMEEGSTAEMPELKSESKKTEL